MVEMARGGRVQSIGPEYNNFLYATIGAEANGSALSVLSAMARMNLDPWREAANLAELSAKAAAGRLSAMIATLPGAQAASDEPGAIAARLVKLLPQGRISAPLPQPSGLNLPPYLQAITKVLSAKSALYVIVLLLALMLGVKWFGANRAPPAHDKSASATTQPQSTPRSH